MRVIRELSYLSIDDHAWLNAIRLIWFVISRLSRRKTKDGNWRKTGKRNGVFAGRNLHIEILKGTNFSRSNHLLLPSSSKSSLPFLSRVSLHSSLICIQDCRCSSARHLPPSSLFPSSPSFSSTSPILYRLPFSLPPPALREMPQGIE